MLEQLPLFTFEFVIEPAPTQMYWLDVNVVCWTGEKFLVRTSLFTLVELIRGDAAEEFLIYA